MSLIWTNAALEPKRKFRYLVTFSGVQLTDFQFLAQTCDRPGVKVNMSEHKYFDKSFYHPGRVIWEPNPLNIKVVDIQKAGASVVDTNRSLISTLIDAGFNGLINTDGSIRTVGKQAAVSALGDVNIRVLNSALTALPNPSQAGGTAQLQPAPAAIDQNSIAEHWTLHNAWLESIKPDALDYGAEDILSVTLTLRYDWAKFRAQGDVEPINPVGGRGNP